MILLMSLTTKTKMKRIQVLELQRLTSHQCLIRLIQTSTMRERRIKENAPKALH
jgi:hypothetical protein